MFNWVGQILGGGLSKTAKGIASIFTENKEARGQRRHESDMARLGQYAAEFRRLEDRTWWDSLVDGLNRLPRPLLAFMTIGYFLFAYFDPSEFQVLNVALEAIPEQMWVLLGAIVSFYFVAREFAKQRGQKLSMSKVQFAEQQRRIREIRDTAAAAGPLIEDEAFETEMADRSQPLSNAAIAEWNRRRKNAGS